MARGNARREAYAAGGKATLWSLEIFNVDAFVLAITGPRRKRRQGRGATDRPGSENVRIAAGRLAGEPGRPCIVHAQRPEDGSRPTQRIRARPCLRGIGSERGGAISRRDAAQGVVAPA